MHCEVLEISHQIVCLHRSVSLLYVTYREFIVLGIVLWQLLAELEQWHSSSRYLDTAATDTVHCSTFEQSHPHVDTNTDVGVDADGVKADQVDAVVSSSTQDASLGESSAACLPTFDSSRMMFDSECRDCRLPCRNPQPHELVMYLHAYCYQVRFTARNYTS